MMYHSYLQWSMVVWILIWFIWSGYDVSFSSYISQQNFSNHRYTIYMDIPLKKFTGKKVQVLLQNHLTRFSLCFQLLYIMMLFCDDKINFSVVIYVHLAHNQNTKKWLGFILHFCCFCLIFLRQVLVILP